MSFVTRVTLQCDFESCEEEFSGEAGFTLDEVREEADMDGWVYARFADRPLEAYRDLCAEHADQGQS